jgi:hypothetical protein
MKRTNADSEDISDCRLAADRSLEDLFACFAREIAFYAAAIYRCHYKIVGVRRQVLYDINRHAIIADLNGRVVIA